MTAESAGEATAAPTFFPAPAVARTAPLGTVEQPLPLIIDSDPGLDDALAIGLAVARPEIDLLAVTTVGGNADVRHCTTNALRLLHLYGASDVPVAEGSAGRAVRRDRPGDRDPRRGRHRPDDPAAVAGGARAPRARST